MGLAVELHGLSCVLEVLALQQVSKRVTRHGVVQASTIHVAQVLSILSLEEVLFGKCLRHIIPFVPTLEREVPEFEFVIAVFPPLLGLNVLLHLGNATAPVE